MKKESSLGEYPVSVVETLNVGETLTVGESPSFPASCSLRFPCEKGGLKGERES